MRLFEFESNVGMAVFYGGRFQPMHQGHHQLYKSLANEFGADNVFIATTFGKKQQQMHSKGDFTTDPFTFDEKKKIASNMFGIPESAIINTQPYRPDVSLTGKDPENTATVLAFSEKDAGRLKESKNLKMLPDDRTQLQPASTGMAYFITMPVNEGGMSATDFRTTMASSEASPEEKQRIFTRFFGKFDQSTFDFIEKRLS